MKSIVFLFIKKHILQFMQSLLTYIDQHLYVNDGLNSVPRHAHLSSHAACATSYSVLFF